MPPMTLASIPLQNLYSLLQPLSAPPNSADARFTNWGLSFTCAPHSVFLPETEFHCELILELARREGKTVRAVGVGHSPSDLACTTEYMIRMQKLNRLLEVHAEKRYVVVQAGIILHDLHAELAKHNLAMMNCGSISDQTLAGIIATASHGSGIDFGVMSTHVLGLTLLLADGSRVFCSRSEHRELFLASVCGLGSTGIILSIQLEVEPSFRLKELQYTMSFDATMRDLDKLVHSAEHVRFWWFHAPDTVRVSCSNRTSESRAPVSSWLWHSLFGFHLVQLFLFFGRVFPQLNVWTAFFAAWLINNETVGIDDSYSIFNVECRYPQFTTEWAIPYENAESCLREFRNFLHKEAQDPHGLRPHFPVEIRFSAADDIWLSPSSGQRTCWIGIVQYKPYGFNVPYRKLFQNYEAILMRHQGRPHWAKAHGLRPDALRQMYPRFDDFIRILEEVDPNGMFRNEYVNRHVFGQKIDGRVYKIRQ